MPLKLNIGLSRKVGEPNYSSRGASVNVELELESSLAREPAKLRDRIRQLYELAGAAVNEELHKGESSRRCDHRDGAGKRQQDSALPGTAAQVRAIERLADRQDVDLVEFLTQQHGVSQLIELSRKELSRLIGLLSARASQPPESRAPL